MDFNAGQKAVDATSRARASLTARRLVFVAKPHKKEGATQRVQRLLDDEGLALWENVIHDAAAATRGPSYLARINDGCRHCPVLSSCPAHDEGRQVTSE